ncbi:hypothetical protein BT96DRAFT_1001197 [Gymnopus androsaceus JB14]|uniref:F-box domain-containing protein n=1 Tax=Gymnopus androsaceus JB14 TaxID=1447944 RepID=A0A6A4H2Y4_9AGAR|nr:hypothetical protein BT96DRAFT_1001197 [Gymnopus androsaceus JB14]
MVSAQLYLDRSANSPLIIDLETQGEVRINSALDLVLDHASRWQTFSYTGDYVLSRCIGNERKKEVFPILEDLNLEGYRYNIERSDLACFEHAPRLRAVRTDFFKRSCSELPWTQLTSLDVGVYEAEDIYLLQQCPSLTVLKLRNYQWSTLGPISSASLESFTFVCPKERREEHLLENVFCCFTFPSLAKLVIYSEDSSTTNLIWPLDAFSAFISRSSCALTTLSLSSVVISDVNLIAALRLVPSLTNLFLDGLEDPEGRSPLTSHFISSMQGSSPTHLVPKLCSLSIKFKGTSFDDVAFINMVSSRWTPDRTHAAAIGIDCLRSLVLHFLDREVDEDVYRPLWHLDEMGMRVVITSKK